jgi:NAD+ synthase (glutamine-hydrolysing)
MEFKEKYLKYKEKYHALKQDILTQGGGIKEKYNQLKTDYNLVRQNAFEPLSMNGGEVGFAKGTTRIAVATLNQWSTDYTGNELRIKQAIVIAKRDGAKLILLPELVTCGYSCQDHFLERETHELSFNVIRNLLKDTDLNNILIVIGCPVIHNDVRYNTNFYIFNGQIVLIRPKMLLADDGNYREARWFTPWPLDKFEVFTYKDGLGKYQTTPIGVGIVNCHGVLIASEICEELWVPSSINSDFYLNGVDIVLNGSGSHFETGKLQKRIKLITEATRRSGGVYLYANLEGGDGDRLYFDGRSIIAVNGKIVNIEDGFSLRDVQVMTEDIDLGSILSYRMRNNSFGTQASKQTRFKVINVPFDIAKTGSKYNLNAQLAPPVKVEAVAPAPASATKRVGGTRYKTAHIDDKHVISDEQIEEITNSASAWLWDYMRRSGAMGFQLPLSGGADSASTATIIFNICLLMKATYDEELSDADNRIPNKNVSAFINKFYKLKSSGVLPPQEEITPQLLCSRILNTVYLPTEISGQEAPASPEHLPLHIYVRDEKGIAYIPDGDIPVEEVGRAAGHPETKTGWLAAQLAKKIGATHRVIDIQGMFTAGINGLTRMSGLTYEDMREEVTRGRGLGAVRSKWDLLYQNIQARLRMINTYLLAQATPNLDSPFITPWSFLLVLGSSNADEILVGYYTKYDASAADINPIGSLSKTYVNRILDFYGNVKQINPLRYIRNATPTAELVKPGEVAMGQAPPPRQTDETDMRITYEQIFEMGKLRADGYGPIDAYIKIMDNAHLKEVFSKDPNNLRVARDPKIAINLFYTRYNINRNKTTIIPPSVHLTPSPDDNRYDLRPFLLPGFTNSRQDLAIKSIT